MNAEPREPRAPGAAHAWHDALLVYAQPRIASMLFLGFSAGLPFYLVFSTLSAWLRQAGIQRGTIGMLSWVGILYSIKFLWAPFVDRMPLPVLQRALGRRRAWMLVAQIGIVAGLLRLAASDPAAGISSIALAALGVAFCAATQDIALDAWRIESARVSEQGAMAAAYQIGYRVALITGSAGALTIAGRANWHASYTTMAILGGVGILTTLLVREPRVSILSQAVEREARVVAWLERRAEWPQWSRHAGEWVTAAVVCPLVDFFQRCGGGLAVLTLCFIGLYRLTEFTMGSMANPFYIDHGYTLTQIATVVKVYGLLMSMFGVVAMGVLVARFSLVQCLALGSVLLMASNLGFATLATTREPTLLGLGLVNGLDNLAIAAQGVALIAFLSSLTSQKYTATQYALFSSLYALPGKILEGTSGFVVDHIGYPLFFTYTAALSVPGLILLYLLKRRGAIVSAGATRSAASAPVSGASDGRT